MQKAKLDEYIEQGRVIVHKDADLFFWKDKDGKISLECQGRFKATVDAYRFPDGKALVFSNKAGDGYGQTDYNNILITNTTLDDLTVHDELIGRVFSWLYSDGGDAGIYYFVFSRIDYDSYMIMKFEDNGESECIKVDAKTLYEWWHTHKIVAKDAEGSIETLGDFIRKVAVDL